MEFMDKCPNEHIIERIEEGTFDTGPTFRIRCGEEELGRRVFKLDTVNQGEIDGWASSTLDRHQIGFLREQCARLAAIIDELHELRE